MADPMMIPPWIQPADTARQYATGVQLGVNIAQQTQRLQAQREQEAIASEMRLRQLQEQSEERRQRIEMDRAYHDQVVGLRQQQLEEAAQKNQMATRLAATKFAAQQEYRARVAAGDDPAKVMLELGPAMGAGSSNIGMAMRASKIAEKPQWVPANAETGAPGHFETPTGSVHIPAAMRVQNNTALINATVSELKARRKAINDSLATIIRPNTPELKAQQAKGLADIEAINQRIAQILPQTDLARPMAATSTATNAGVKEVRWDKAKKKYVVVEPVPASEWKGHEGDNPDDETE